MLGKFIAGWSDFVVERRWLVILLTITLLVGLMIPMKDLYFDNSNEMWFIPGDPALANYEKLREKFGSSQYFVVGLEAREGEKTVITRENLQIIARITEFLEDHEFVTKVSSLSKYQYINAEDDVLNTYDLIEDIETLSDTPEEMERIRNIMAGETLAHDFLITQDLRHTIIMARTLYKKGEIDHQVQLVRDFDGFLLEQKIAEKGYRIRIAGSPVIAENFLTASMKDSATTMPIMFLLIVVFLWFAFRRISGVLMPLVVILGSVFAVVGVIGMFGWALNSVNVTLPVLLMTIGIGDSVHIIVEFYHFIDAKKPSDTAAKETVKALFIPCFNTSVTTMLGFLAVATTHLRPIREYGIAAAIGVLIAFVISVTTLPALLSFLNPKPGAKRKKIQEGAIARLTNSLTPFAYKHSKTIVLVTLLIVGVSVWFASQIRVDSNFINSFKEDAKIRKDMLYFDAIYNGGYNLEFIVDSGKQGGVKDPAFLRRALALQNYLETLEKTGKANSMINYLRKMNQTMNGDDPDAHRIPDTRELVAQLLFLYSNSSPEEDLTDLMSFDERYLRLSVSVRNIRTSKMQALVDTIEEEIKTNFPDLKADIAGDTILWNNMSVYIQHGIVSSFSLALITIVICFFILLRSFKYGLFSVIPSLTPIMVAGGVMGILGIDLDMATVMVGAVSFGIAVDDTIHMMNRYVSTRKKGRTRKESVNAALTESGRALIFTSLILYFGFSILMLSSFVPNIYFGFFTGIILISALIAVLILLPAVMFLTGDKE